DAPGRFDAGVQRRRVVVAQPVVAPALELHEAQGAVGGDVAYVVDAHLRVLVALGQKILQQRQFDIAVRGLDDEGRIAGALVDVVVHAAAEADRGGTGRGPADAA